MTIKSAIAGETVVAMAVRTTTIAMATFTISTLAKLLLYISVWYKNSSSNDNNDFKYLINTGVDQVQLLLLLHMKQR